MKSNVYILTDQKLLHITDDKKDKTYWITIWMCIGISIETAIGSAINNLSLCMPIWLSLGSCIGVAFSIGKD